MTLLKRIDNIDVVCADIDRMARFYHHDLGLDYLYEREDGDNWFAIQAGDVTLYFFPGSGEHAPPFAENLSDNPPAIESFSFAVDDLDEAIAAIDGKVDWAGPIRDWHHPNGTWYRFRFFRDPEGNKVSITEPHKV